MRKIYIYFIVFSLVLSSCSARLARPGEKPLFPDKSAGKWWIISTITKDKYGKNIHRCLLLSTENANDEKFVSFFSSQFTESDSAFYSGTESSANISLKTKLTFPVDIGILPNNNWYLQLKRQKMNMAAVLKKNNADSSAVQTSSIKFKKQKPFVLAKMMDFPEIWAVNPLDIKEHSKDMPDTKSDGSLFISMIAGKEIFFNTSKNKTVVWIDLLMQSGKKTSFLLTVANDGSVTINSFSEWDKMSNMVSTNVYQMNTTDTVSNGNITGKKYPLFYKVFDKGENTSYFLKPVIIEQELAANKSSLWMGAIVAFDSLTGNKIGAGNMYIFRQ